MSFLITGARIRKELGRRIAGHRLTVSDSGHFVQVEPDTVAEVAFVVDFAAREGVKVLPASGGLNGTALDGWHIRVALKRMSAISDYSADSGLVCAQAGARVQDLQDWLLDKGRTLAVLPDDPSDVELWEFLLSPRSGRIGPRFGCKWDQVFSLHAVLPNGKLFRNSLSPGRATGPDFSRIILMGRGAFGLPLEATVSVQPLPKRRVLLSLALSDLKSGVERAWQVAREAVPEFLEIGLLPRGAESGLPSCVAFVELWGEGRSLSVRRELVLKHFGDVASVFDVPYEKLLGMEDTWQFGPGDTVQFYARRESLDALAAAVASSELQGAARLRVRGFVDNHACVTVDSATAGTCGAFWTRPADFYTSPDGQELLADALGVLDPLAIMGSVPQIWSEPREA